MTPTSRLIVAVRISFVLALALTVQLGIAPSLGVFGVQGDLMLLVAVAGAAAAGPDRGAAIGFAAGLSYDLLLQTPFGLTALSYAMVAYLVGGLQDSVLRAARWIPVVTAAAASAVGVILYGVFGTVLGADLIRPELLRVAAIVAVLNAIVSPVATPLMQWATGAANGARTRGVFR
jgi:rod shape-determining protein MreD